MRKLVRYVTPLSDYNLLEFPPSPEAVSLDGSQIVLQDVGGPNPLNPLNQLFSGFGADFNYLYSSSSPSTPINISGGNSDTSPHANPYTQAVSGASSGASSSNATSNASAVNHRASSASGASGVSATPSSQSLAVALDAANPTPVTHIPGTVLRITEDAAVKTIHGISVSVADANSEITVRLSVAHGTLGVPTTLSSRLTDAGITGLTNAGITGQGTNTLILTGTATAINATLTTLSYTVEPNFNGSDTLTVSSSVGGSPALSSSGTMAIDVAAVNDAPTIAGIPDSAPLIFFGVNDVDGANTTLYVTLVPTGGSINGFTDGSANGLTTHLEGSTVHLTGTAAAINAALAAASFTASAAGAASIAVRVSDVSLTDTSPATSSTRSYSFNADRVPLLSIPAGVSGGATAAEATAASGVVTVHAESGSTVLVTFTDSASPTAHSFIRTVTGTGAAQAVTLASTDLGTGAAKLLDGTITVSATATDAAGNASTTGTGTFTLDTVAPTLTTISSDRTALKKGETATITFTFSEDPGSSFIASDITLPSGGQISGLTTTSAVRTATFTPTDDLNAGSASISVANGTFSDAAGNLGTGGSAASISINTKVPSLTGASLQGATTLNLTFDTALDSAAFSSITPAALNTLFSFQTAPSGGGGYTTVSSPFTAISVSGSTVTLTLSNSAYTSGQLAQISYTDPAGDQSTGVVQDAGGNDLVSFTDTAVITTPVILGFAVSDTVSSNGTALGKAGETVTVAVRFSANVTLTASKTYTVRVQVGSNVNEFFDATLVTTAGTQSPNSSYNFSGNLPSTTGLSTSALQLTSLTFPTGASPVAGSLALTQTTYTLASTAYTVDSLAPTVSSIALVAKSESTFAVLNAGDTVDVAVTFSEAVTITGSPRVALTIGASTVYAGYLSADARNTGTTKYFRYTVAAGDTDANGISIATNALSLNGGSISDTAGNAATTTHSTTVADNAAYRIDTSTPAAPTLALGAGVSGGATEAEALQASGVVSVIAESGSTVRVTFTDSDSPANSFVKTVTGSGAAQGVTLANADITGPARLISGNITVSATATDTAGNTSNAGTSSFTLDTRAPDALWTEYALLGSGLPSGQMQEVQLFVADDNKSLTWLGLTGNNASLFNLSSDGHLSLKQAADPALAAKQYLSVRVADQAGNEALRAVTVNLVNENPLNLLSIEFSGMRQNTSGDWVEISGNQLTTGNKLRATFRFSQPVSLGANVNLYDYLFSSSQHSSDSVLSSAHHFDFNIYANDPSYLDQLKKLYGSLNFNDSSNHNYAMKNIDLIDTSGWNILPGYKSIEDKRIELQALLESSSDLVNLYWTDTLPTDIYTEVSYSFLSSFPAYLGTPAVLPNVNPGTSAAFVAFTAQQKSTTRLIAAEISNFCLLKFVEVANPDHANIRFGNHTNMSAGGYAEFPFGAGQGQSGSDIWITADNTNPMLTARGGNWDRFVIVHELGHALGLKHPFEGDYELPEELDTRLHTQMSYTDITDENGVYFYGTGMMPLDVQALQFLYGANNSYQTGNDTYQLNYFDGKVSTLWDSGGVDTISAQGQGFACTINLNPGEFCSFSNTGRTVGNQSYYITRLGIAFGAEIENARGGTAADTLIGNTLDNTLTGGSGADIFEFADNWGDDRITDFAPGSDRISFRTDASVQWSDLSQTAAPDHLLIAVHGQTIYLNGITTTLAASNFVFAV